MTATRLARIIIVDEHEILRHALALYLGQCDGVELVGEACHAHEALGLCDHCQPDVVLIDMTLRDIEGFSVTRAIRRNHPEASVIGMSGMESDGVRSVALDAGAAQLLYKGRLSDDLMAAISSVMCPA